MSDIAITEFPFVEALPKREKSKFQTLLDHLEEVGRIVDEKGMLLPHAFAAKLGGVSQQRIDQLCDAGKLERVDFAGRPFVTEKSLVAWAQSERSAGRPVQPISNRKLWKAAKEVAGGSRKK